MLGQIIDTEPHVIELFPNNDKTLRKISIKSTKNSWELSHGNL